MEIYLLRHGRTLSSGTYTGCTDVPLSDRGRQQITTLSPFLQSIKFDTCFCSPLIRCVQTWNLLEVDSDPIFDESLKEVDFGFWEGLSFEQVQRDFSDELADWEREGEDFRFPGGEMIRAFNARIIRWLDNLLKKDFNRVLIVAHGGVIRIAICHLLAFETARAFAFNPREGSLSMVNVVGGFGQLELMNCKGL